MNYRYGILATALAVGLFAVPATAGVTDVTGGSGVKVNTTVRNHINEVNTYKTNEVHRDDIKKSGGTVDKSSVQYQYKGVLNYTDKYGSHSKYNITGGNGFVYTSSNRGDAYSKVSNSLRNYDYKYQHDGRTSGQWAMTEGQFSHALWMTGNDGMGNSYSEDVTHLKTTGNIKTHNETSTKRTTDKYTDYKYVGSSDKLDRSTLSYDSTTYAPGTILVGDPDAIFNAYTASGSVTINEFRDDYYTRTHRYENDHITQDTITTTKVKTGTRTEIYQLTANRTWSPIVLDLDGDGKIEASNGQYLAHDGFSDRVVAFDFFGNGFPMLMEWVGPNDGLLCRPNADGSVKGTNLFGSANGFRNGYEEMASLDIDNSGSLEGAELKDLRVWTDVNANGIAEPNELKTLDELGITSIKVSHNNYASTFVRNGQTYKSFDWWPNCREMRKVDMASVIK